MKVGAKKRWRSDSRSGRFVRRHAGGVPVAHDCEVTLLYLASNFAKAVAETAMQDAAHGSSSTASDRVPGKALEEGDLRKTLARLRGTEPDVRATARAKDMSLAQRIRGQRSATAAQQPMHAFLCSAPPPASVDPETRQARPRDPRADSTQ